MSRIIDHLILAVGPSSREEITTRLTASGFVHQPGRVFEGGNYANEAAVFAGGAFIEMLRPLQDPGIPEVWFSDTPRIQGVGYTTRDPQEYDELAAPWASIKDSWNREFGGERPDGRVLKVRGAGPVPHLSEFYPFIMDRPKPDYGHLAATPELRKITFAGARHEEWRRDMAEWFRLAEHPDGLASDDGVVVAFAPGPHPNVRLSFAFDVQENPGVIEISGGVIELNQA